MTTEKNTAAVEARRMANALRRLRSQHYEAAQALSDAADEIERLEARVAELAPRGGEAFSPKQLTLIAREKISEAGRLIAQAEGQHIEDERDLRSERDVALARAEKAEAELANMRDEREDS